MKTIVSPALVAAATVAITSRNAKCDNFNPKEYAQHKTERLDQVVDLTDAQEKEVYALYLEQGKTISKRIKNMDKADCTKPACDKKAECKKAECDKKADCKKGDCKKAECTKKAECKKVDCKKDCATCDKKAECKKADCTKGECKKAECTKKAECKKADCTKKADCKKVDCKKDCATCDRKADCKKVDCKKDCATCDKKADCKKGECKKAECTKKADCKKTDCTKKADCKKVCDKNRRPHHRPMVNPEAFKAHIEKLAAILTPEQMELLKAEKAKRFECAPKTGECCPTAQTGANK